MRYRPFGPSGAAVSAITLSVGADMLARGREAAMSLLFAALEQGINSYRLETADPVVAEVLGEALSHLDRKLALVSLTLGEVDPRRQVRDFTSEGITAAVDRVLHYSGLGWIDVAVLDAPGEHELRYAGLNALKTMKRTERLRLAGVAGDGEAMDAFVSTGAFDVLVTPCNVLSDWKVRARIRAAREQDMMVFATDTFPQALLREPESEGAPVRRGLFGLGAKAAAPPPAANPYAFLTRTARWTPETICLAHALTDPALTSVIVQARNAQHLEALSETPERDLPPGLAAQMEMARVDAAA